MFLVYNDVYKKETIAFYYDTVSHTCNLGYLMYFFQQLISSASVKRQRMQSY